MTDLAAIAPIGIDARHISIRPIGILGLGLELQQIDHHEGAVFRRIEKGLGLIGSEMNLILELHRSLLF